MTLKTPYFWYRDLESKPEWREALLSPISGIYNAFYQLHQKSKTPYKADIPVICIGNIVAGGTGKTPTVIALMQTIRKHELAKKPFFLIRGYGGAEKGPLLADPQNHTAWDIGDEALILAEHAPTIVSADRAEGVKLAKQHGADMVLMDDGLQNPGIHKDLRFVVINGDMGFGNHKMIPAGPLRQPLQTGIEKAHGFILIGDDKRNTEEALPKDKPFIHARLKPTVDYTPDKNLNYVAFAGLGYPDKFFSFLKEDVGLSVRECVRFGDHYPYEKDDIEALDKKARAINARLITTEKDFLRIPKVEGVEIDVIPVEMTWDDETSLVSVIKAALA